MVDVLAAPRIEIPGAGRGTVVALVMGAAVAGAQTALDELSSVVPMSTDLLPVAHATLDRAVQTAPGSLAVVSDGDPAVTADDLASLAKGAVMTERAGRRDALVRSALASGAPGAALSKDGVVVEPVAGRVTSSAGPRWGTTHNGLDVANRIGTPIFAVADGVVERSGPASGFGLWVVLRHADGTRSIYGHINRAFVSTGQKVAAGDRIAEVGNRGQSTGPHLHLEIETASGEKVDPQQWLRARGVDVGGGRRG